MKKLCFGTLLILMYQARGQSVTYKKICEAVFIAYGCDGMAVRDKSLPGHLKTGHDNVPPDVVSAARNMPFEEAIAAFEQGVSPLIKETNVKPFIHAIVKRTRNGYILNDQFEQYRAAQELDITECLCMILK